MHSHSVNLVKNIALLWLSDYEISDKVKNGLECVCSKLDSGLPDDAQATIINYNNASDGDDSCYWSELKEFSEVEGTSLEMLVAAARIWRIKEIVDFKIVEFEKSNSSLVISCSEVYAEPLSLIAKSIGCTAVVNIS